MSSDECTHLAWLDLETTGLDRTRDPIIEFAMIITDMDLNPPDGYQPFVTAVNPGPGLLKARLDITPWALETHTENGLLRQIQSGKCMTINECEKAAIAHLATYTDPGKVILAGSGVANFDKPVLQLQMPNLHDWFPYYSIDIGVMRRFIKHILDKPEWIPDVDPGTHRAFDDARYALYQAHSYRDLMTNSLNYGWQRDHPIVGADEEG